MKRLVPTTSAALAAVLLNLVGSATPAAASAECTDAVATATQAYYDTVLAARTRVATAEAAGGTDSSAADEKAAKTALLAAVRAGCKKADLADFEAGSCGGQTPTIRKMVKCLAKSGRQAAAYSIASIFDKPIPVTPTPRPTPTPTTTVVIRGQTPIPTKTPVRSPGLPRQMAVNGPCQSQGFGECVPPLQCKIGPNAKKVCVPPPLSTPRALVSPTSAPTAGVPTATAKPSATPTPRPPTPTPPRTPTPRTPTPRPPTPTPPRTPTPNPQCTPIPANQCTAMGGTISPITGCCVVP